MSTLEGWIRFGSNGSNAMRPASTSARIVRSESTIGAPVYARALKETRHGADLRIALDDPVGDQLEELAALIVQ